jgi:V/A-type H+-transporting ATPase subunit A
MSGVLARISGPTVGARGLEGVALNELVLVGEARLLGEVVRVQGDLATLQVYEDTTGLQLGEPAVATGQTLAVELGPGLLGQIFDGVQRPLPALAALEGDFLGRGTAHAALDRERRWDFAPAVRAGDELRPGMLLGHASLEPVIAPPDAAGRIAEVRMGDVSAAEPVVLLEGGRALSMMQRWPVRKPRPYAKRLTPDVPFLTGQRVLDCFFPVAAGGTAIVPGGFGTGKTVLEQSLAKFAAADVVVYVGCGERGNEMSELLDEFPRLTDPQSGRPLLERTVMIVNTSNMPVAAREASIYTGVTIAEYFRDLGRKVALVIDSTSRWAEALREISSRLEEMPGEEGYPTYLASRVAQFYERAGRVVPLSGAGEGIVTIVGTVSPPGGDFSEPVTQASLRTAGALWALSPELAHRRHYPAIDWAQSFSLDAPRLDRWFAREAGESWSARRDEAMRLLQRERELQEIAQLVGIEALQDAERVVLESARLLREGFLRQSAYDAADATCPPQKALAMLELLLHFHGRADAAVREGAPLRSLLDPRLDQRLLRMGEIPSTQIGSALPSLRQAIDAAVEKAKAS